MQKDGKNIMLYRNKKQNDVNKGKWIGVSGKFEDYKRTQFMTVPKRNSRRNGIYSQFA